MTTQFELRDRNNKISDSLSTVEKGKISGSLDTQSNDKNPFVYPATFNSLYTYANELDDHTNRTIKSWLQTLIGGVLLSFFASMLFVWIATLGTTVGRRFGDPITETITTALAQGFGLFAALSLVPKKIPFCINPTITLIELFMGHSRTIHSSWIHGIIYTILAMAFSLVGSITGAAITSAIDSSEVLGLPIPRPINANFTVGSIFLLEVIGSFLLAWIFFIVSYDPKPRKMKNGAHILGLALASLVFIGNNYTGASFNWIRHFGPLVLSGQYRPLTDWIYYIAPLVGHIVAALAWYFLFRTSRDSDNLDSKKKIMPPY